MPDKDSLAKARETANGFYEDSWNDADTPRQKTNVARQVIKDAVGGAAGTADYYALLDGARVMAEQAGSAETAIKAVDLLAAQFQVDGIGMRARALAEVAPNVVSQSEKRRLVEHSLHTAAKAIVADRLNVARQMAELATREAPSAGNDTLVAESAQCMAVVSALERELPGVAKARADLAANPKDQSAALIVGRYECFCKREWKEGLPLLAQAVDQSLGKLAIKTLAGIGVPDQTMQLGHDWWQVAEGLAGWRQHCVRGYAASLYGLYKEALLKN